MRLVLFAALLALAGCAFSSDDAFVAPSDAAYPIADGARYDWSEHTESADPEIVHLTFHRAPAGGYAVSSDDHADRPMAVVIVAIADTPEEDYLVQAQLQPNEATRAYAFMWRTAEGFRVVTGPNGLEAGGKVLTGVADLCRWRAYHECALASRDDLLTLYRRALYPRFVAGHDTPAAYTTLSPARAASETAPSK